MSAFFFDAQEETIIASEMASVNDLMI